MAVGTYEIDELLNEAIITGTPVILVEGIDDIPIYEKISSSLDFDVEVYAIENIEGYTEGCEQVINAITELNLLDNTRHPLNENILGIIDKDVRDFRGEVPNLDALFMLNYYSIESHFLTKGNILNVLKLTTKANKSLLSEELISIMMDEIETSLFDIYYFSLESLRKALDPDYQSSFCYSYSFGRIYDETTRVSVLNKKDELDVFASDLGVFCDFDTLKKISKGKWLLDLFSHEILKSINKLPSKCVQNSIEKCRSCTTGIYDKCMYKIKDGFNKNAIKGLIFSSVDEADVDYIKYRINTIRS